MAPLIEFRNVYKIYQMGDTQVRAADGISMKIDQGEFVAIVGQSGSGKSTCMNIIGCLDVPTHGQYLLKGQDVGKMKDDQLADIRNKTLGFIFQQYNLLPKLNLLENVEVSLMYAGAPKRVSIARALAGAPSVILADEPTGALDSRTGRDVLGLLQELHNEGNTIVLITHDNSIARQAQRIIRLEDGKVVYDGPADGNQAVVNPEEAAL